MKKLLTTLLLIGVLISVAPVNLQAATTDGDLTSADVKVLAPQMIQVLNTMTSVVSGVQQRYAQEDKVLRQVGTTLGMFSTFIEENEDELTATDLEQLEAAFDFIETSIEDIEEQRKDDGEAFDDIIEQMEEIVEELVKVQK